jgi:hypothetical protein
VQSDDPSMLLAVMMHCLPDDHSAFGGKPVWPLLALLKDADGLDRVRFGDLDPSYFRFEATRGMVKFAEDLYSQSHRRVKEGPNFFTDLMKVAERILGKPVPIPASVLGSQVTRAKGRAPRVPATPPPAARTAVKSAAKAPVKPAVVPARPAAKAVAKGAARPAGVKPKLRRRPVAAR